MNTSTEALCKLLKNYLPRTADESSYFNYDGVCLYSEASEQRTEKLIYVGAVSSVVPGLSLPSAVCFVCINDEPSSGRRNFPFACPVIILDSASSVTEVFNLLLETFFSRYHREQLFREKLLELMAIGATMTTILQEATREYANPFIVFDSSFSLVAHSVAPSLNLPEAQHVVSNRYANVDVLQQLKDEGIIDMLQHTVRPTIIKLPNGYEKLAVNLFDNRECVGMIGFYNYVRPFEESDYEMVSFVAKLVGSYFHKSEYFSTVWTPYDYIFNCLLTSGNLPSSKILDELKISLPPQMRLMSVSFSSVMQMHDLPLKFIENSITKMLSKCHNYIYNQNVLFLCKSQLLDPEANEGFFGWLEDFLNKYKLRACISNPFSDLSDFSDTYKDLVAVSSLQSIFPQEHPYFFYIDYTVPHMLLTLGKTTDIRHFYHPAFRTLMDYDKQYNTQYLECLIVYLKYNGNMTECANYFSIHYNSIKYRMKVISDICGIDLHDINTFTHLYLSSLIYSFNRGREIEQEPPADKA